MSEPSHALRLQMLEWLAARPREYREVMDAWRTSCPRLTIWEDAWSDGLLVRHHDTGQISLSEKGAALLSKGQR